MKQCTSCGKQFPQVSEFCNGCGAALPKWPQPHSPPHLPSEINNQSEKQWYPQQKNNSKLIIIAVIGFLLFWFAFGFIMGLIEAL